MMKSNDFVTLLRIVEDCKTLYVLGGWGAPLNERNKQKYTNNLEYNRKRKSMIMAQDADCFAFDCSGLIKSIGWGFCMDPEKINGGAIYKANNVPDCNADTMISLYCDDVSEDFNQIQKGELVWIPGHVGIFIGDGKVIECSPRFKNCVQITGVINQGVTNGNCRRWKKHGKLKWINYGKKAEPLPFEEYTVQKGDCLSLIGKKTGTDWHDIAKDNNLKAPYLIRTGQVLKIRRKI